MIDIVTRVAAQLELDFNSVERISEYLDVPQEAPAIINDRRPPAYWPSSDGSVIFEDLVIRYAETLPAVLRNISFTINPREKIGVVGRTGSGKSTLALSLLRMVEAQKGRIIIDGIDIATIGLEDLRTRVTIVSQDVSLFAGTIRSNLDPLGEHTDQECWDVLERCHLLPLLRANFTNGEFTLDMSIGKDGSLSAGERQLVSLSRAVLRRTNIIILDEATSQIDNKLDDQIQKTIREELSSALVITIAHRLKTIIDYDRILVLDNGEIVEFGPPTELLAQPGSAFREMCRKSADWPLLRSILGGSSGRGLFDEFDLARPASETTTTGHPAGASLSGTSTSVGAASSSHLSSGATLASTHQETASSTSIHTYSVIGSVSPAPQPTASLKAPLMPANVTPTTTENIVHASESGKPMGASSFTSTAELALWKVLGVTVLCIGVVATIILSVVFFDSWWGFVKDVVRGRKRSEPQEELVPDWEKRSWEVKFASQDGHRYPSLSSVESITKWKGMKAGGNGDGKDSRKDEKNSSNDHKITVPSPTYLPDYDPYKPNWLPKM
ncbi:hypothetical protein ONZ45_g16692 [Pleurotus djamor]|nr:hypothetical protein ONZ45_g16692 [Pleurotus djamor]